MQPNNKFYENKDIIIDHRPQRIQNPYHSVKNIEYNEANGPGPISHNQSSDYLQNQLSSN